MRRLLLLLLLAVTALAAASLAPVAAQEASPEASPPAGGPGADPAFSNQLLPTLGYPELALEVTDLGLQGAPSTLAAGRYLVALSGPETSPGYLDFVQPPAGLTDAEAAEQLVLAARDDLAQDGWVYAGGSYALPGETVHFVVELTPGAWQIGATRESVPPDGEEVVEWATLTPLTVTEADPAASPVAEPTVAATVELQDVAFGGLEGPLPAGPQIWKVTNTGEQPRQVVLWRTPELVDAADWQGILAPMMGGTPSPDVPSFDQMVWVGYVAILSPGQTVWIEFDLAPGFYSATSWVVDPETGMPALLLGMAQGFEVQ